MKLTPENCLIAYFSRVGQNYVEGKIEDFEIGNTAIVAKMIQERTQGRLFEIRSESEYPYDYTEATRVAQREKKADQRPVLIENIDEPNDYEYIFIGYPNWWGTMPMPVYSFLESHDFTNRIILPFCTHEGSGMGTSEKDIARICPNATILKGLAIQGTKVKQSKDRVDAWIDGLGKQP